jgi:lysophospholipase L1-like esterase
MYKLLVVWIVFLILIAGVLLIAGEIFFRTVYNETWYEGFSSDRIEHVVRLSDIPLNSKGLRDAEYDNPKTLETFRILVLGDSFTFGSGIKRIEDLYAKILEQKLNESKILGDNIRFEVLNGGLQNKITGDWLELLQSIVTSFKPDMLLVVFSLRDGCKYSDLHEVFRKTQIELKERNEKLLLYRHSSLFKFIKNRIDMREISKKHIESFNSWYIGSPEQTIEWESAKMNVLKMRQIANENKASFYFVIFPILFELNDNYPFNPIMKALQSYLKQNQIDYLSLFDSFKGKSGPSLWVSKYDQHPNEEGHRIAADAIFSYVSNKIKSTSR